MSQRLPLLLELGCSELDLPPRITRRRGAASLLRLLGRSGISPVAHSLQKSCHLSVGEKHIRHEPNIDNSKYVNINGKESPAGVEEVPTRTHVTRMLEWFQAGSARTTACRTSPQSARTFTSISASARVLPRFTAATGMPCSRARFTKR